MADLANRNASVRHLVPKKRSRKVRGAGGTQAPRSVAQTHSPAVDVLKVRAHAIPKHRQIRRSLAGRWARLAVYWGMCAAIAAVLLWKWPDLMNERSVNLAPAADRTLFDVTAAADLVAQDFTATGLAAAGPAAARPFDAVVPVPEPQTSGEKPLINFTDSPSQRSRQTSMTGKQGKVDRTGSRSAHLKPKAGPTEIPPSETGGSNQVQIAKPQSLENQTAIDSIEDRIPASGSTRNPSENISHGKIPVNDAEMFSIHADEPLKARSNPGSKIKGASNQLIEFKLDNKLSGTAPTGNEKILQLAGIKSQEDSRVRVLSVPVDGMVTAEHKGIVRTYRVGQALPDGQMIISADSTSGDFVLAPPGKAAD